MQEKKYRVLDRVPMAGDLVRLKTNGLYSGVMVGEVYPVRRVKTYNNGGKGVFIAGEHLLESFNNEYDYVFYYPEECETVEEILPGDFKVGDRVRINHTPAGTTFATVLYGGQTGELEYYDGTTRCPWRVKLDKLHNCIWVGTDELEPLPEPEYDPDDVRLTHPAELDEDDESGCTLEDVETIPDAIGFLYSVRDSLQEVTFTAAGDIIAKFK